MIAYPEKSEEQGGCQVPLSVEEVGTCCEKNAVAKRFPGVCAVWTLVQSRGLELLVQYAVVGNNGFLSLEIERWVLVTALLPLALFLLDGILLSVLLLLLCAVDGRLFRLNQRQLLRVAGRSAGRSADARVLSNQFLADDGSSLD